MKAQRFDILDKPLVILSEASEDMATRTLLPVRTVNALEAHGIYTVEDLLNKTEQELRSIPNFGDKTMSLIFSVLEEFGFYRTSKLRDTKT